MAGSNGTRPHTNLDAALADGVETFTLFGKDYTILPMRSSDAHAWAQELETAKNAPEAGAPYVDAQVRMAIRVVRPEMDEATLREAPANVPSWIVTVSREASENMERILAAREAVREKNGAGAVSSSSAGLS